MADGFSIDDVNKLRLSLGLKQLTGNDAKSTAAEEASSGSEEEEQGSTLESRQAEGYDNWKKLQDEEKAKKQRLARSEAIKKAREQAQRVAKLEGKGLGEEDDSTALDTRNWLLQQKKRQKKLEKQREKAQKLEEELREREEREYTSKDLAGVKVAHETDEFDEEGGEHILTLKDATIEEYEEEGDELENFQLREKVRLEDKLQSKKRKAAYNPNEQFGEGGKILLQQYDEVIDGKKRKLFTLNAEGSTTKAREPLEGTDGPPQQAISLDTDILKDLTASDYQEPREVKIKKPKKKKAKSTRPRASDEDDMFQLPNANGKDADADSMDVDSEAATSAVRERENFSFVDDDDLQAALTIQRRDALKNRKKSKPEDLARQIRKEAFATPNGDSRTAAEEGGLVIDETSEFVSNLQRPEPENPRDPPSKGNGRIRTKSPSVEADDETQDVDMDKSYNEIDDEREATPKDSGAPDLTETGLAEEATVQKGVADALKLMTQRGLIQKSDGSDANASFRDREKFLADKRRREAAADLRAKQQRERDRASGKLEYMSARDREEYAQRSNNQRNQLDARQEAEIFNREYKPDVQLKYVDDYGRQMTQKEAFKHLSHQFHGKGSGKQKTEKHLKKIKEERKKEAQSVMDSGQGTGMNSALGATTKKNKQVGMRLA